MTTLSGSLPVVYDIREESNTQFDFLNYLCALIEGNHLISGDWVVCDNAAVHVAGETLDAIFALLGAYDIRLLFLPTYSPELNPCELVFALVKKALRKMKKSGLSLWMATAACMADITLEHVVSFYGHCLLPAG